MPKYWEVEFTWTEYVIAETAEEAADKATVDMEEAGVRLRDLFPNPREVSPEEYNDWVSDEHEYNEKSPSEEEQSRPWGQGLHLINPNTPSQRRKD